MSLKINWLFFFLLGVVVCLPLFEAPKTYFYILMVVFWLIKSWKIKEWGGKWLIIDTVFLFWMLTALLVSINALVSYGYSGSGFFDIFRFILVGWVVSRTNYSHKEIGIIVVASSASTLIALIQSYFDCPTGGGCFELNSVGHVNHSALYVLINFSFLMSFLAFSGQFFNKMLRYFLWVVLFVFGWSILDTNSRAASVGLIFVSLFVGWLWLKKQDSKRVWVIALFCIGLLSVTAYTYPPVFVTKHFRLMQDFGDEAPRVKIRRFSYFAFRTNPFLGVGFDNFGKLTRASIKNEAIKVNGVFDEALYLPHEHAHNIYYTYLVSGGVLVTSAFLWFWGWLITRLFFMQKSFSGINCGVWISCASVLLVNLGIGFVNTSFHHEVAIFSMIIMAIFINDKRQIIA